MNTKNKRMITKMLTSLLAGSFLIMNVFAENIDVTANLDSGTYNKVIKVELNVTDSNAKTFYSFEPNWWPGDTNLYTWAIIIKKSTPLVFFSVLTTSNESKIKINDYIINYPTNLKFSPWATFNNWNVENLQIINNDSQNIDLSYWIVKSDWSNIMIPENTIIQAWWTYNISGITGTWIVTLFSPDEEKKDSVEIIAPIVEPVTDTSLNNSWVTENSWETQTQEQNINKEEVKEVSVVKPIKKISKKPTTSNVALIKKETPKINQEPVVNNNPTTTNNQTDSWINNQVNNNWTVKSNNIPEVQNNNNTNNNSDNSFNNSLKTSVKDVSDNSSGNANYFIFGLLLFSLFWWITMKVLNKKQSWN